MKIFQAATQYKYSFYSTFKTTAVDQSAFLLTIISSKSYTKATTY